MNLRLIMNPGSCSGRGRRLWAGWEAGLRRAGIRFETTVTEAPGHAVRLARDAREADTVVAVGGDGTINEVLDGVLQSGRPELRMGVLYAGTSPDFCQFHGIPTEPDEALKALLRGAPAQVDAVHIAFTRQDGSAVESHFGCGCNIGLGARLARTSNRLRRYVGDLLGTGLAAVDAIAGLSPVPLEVVADGVAWPMAPVNNLSILKNPLLASGLRVNVDLRPDDGRLWLVGVHGRSRAGLIGLLPGFYSGRAVQRVGVLLKSCATVKIRAEQPCEIEFDGDPRGFLPAEIRILPRALNLIGGAA